VVERSFLSRLRSLEQWKKNQIAVTISASGVRLGVTLVMPFLPTYVRELGITDTGAIALWSGILFSISPALAAITGPMWGKIADRYGIKLVVLRAALGNCLCWFLMAFPGNVWHLLVFRAALGMVGGFNAVSVAAITQLTPREKTSEAIGTLQSVQILSAAVGPFVGGLLSQTIGIRNTFFLTAAAIFVSVLSIIILYKDAEKKPKDETTSAAPSKRDSYLRHPEYLLPMLILFSIQMTDRTYAPILPLFLEQLGTPVTRIALVSGTLFSLAAIAEAFSAWLSGRLASKIWIPRLLITRLGLGVVVLMPLALAQSSTVFFVLRILLALVAGGILTLALTAAGKTIPGEQRGSGYGILSSALMFGGSIGPIVSGLLANWNMRAVFAFNLVIYALLVVAVWRFGKKEPRGALRATLPGSTSSS
jgi:DHA1 family multidrug resistance protein-like MFS transporter